MKLTVLGKLLLDEGWQVTDVLHDHHLFTHSSRPGSTVFITPMISQEDIPTGTHNAILQGAYQRRSNVSWAQFLDTCTEASVILEKHNAVLWARLELPGLLAVTRGRAVDSVLKQLRLLLHAFAGSAEPAYQTTIEALHFKPVYDTSVMWELIKQLKTSNIAHKAGVDTDLVARFMTGTSFPGDEQAARLEQSIRELGRQLMEVSIR